MAGYLGASPVPQTIQKKQSFTATASQTTFNTTGYTDGNFINVYLNGVRLINGTDYTATNGSDIVLTTGASASDVLDFETFNEIQLADQEFADSVIIENNTAEDSDGGRASKLIYKGKQSGGEQSTLAEIQASHDGTSDDQKADLIFKTNDGSDNNAPTARSKIDSDGNFIFVHDVNVSKDPSVNNYLGVSAKATGQVDISGASPALDVNNRTGNGDIAIFRSGAQTICAIGVANTDNLYIVNPETDTQKGIRLSDSQLVSCNTSGSSTDNVLDLGGVSERFKDLYLGGGAYLGGTSSPNYLDDYETGIWTATISVGSGSLSLDGGEDSCSYIKIGSLVQVQGSIGISGSGASGSLRITNLPFTMASLTEQADLSVCTVNLYNTASNLSGLINAEFSDLSGAATLLIREGGGTSTGVAHIANRMDSGTTIRFTGTYRTSQ